MLFGRRKFASDGAPSGSLNARCSSARIQALRANHWHHRQLAERGWTSGFYAMSVYRGSGFRCTQAQQLEQTDLPIRERTKICGKISHMREQKRYVTS